MNVCWTGATTHNFYTECVCDGGYVSHDKTSPLRPLSPRQNANLCQPPRPRPHRPPRPPRGKLRGLAPPKSFRFAFDTLVCGGLIWIFCEWQTSEEETVSMFERSENNKITLRFSITKQTNIFPNHCHEQ